MTYNEEYKKLIKHILSNGTGQSCRNGAQMIVPHYSFTIQNMEEDHTLKLRKMFYKGVIGEFNTLIDPTPLTNVSQFEANGCNYWKSWADEDGNLNLDYHNKLHPQLEDVIDNIISDRFSRRHVVSLWDHDNAKSNKLSLHCCWEQLIFSVTGDTLHLNWVQRSVDVAVGLPSDVYLAYLFMNYVALKTNLKIGSCMFSLSNVHLYAEHINNAKLLLDRTEKDYENPLKFELKA